MVWAGAVHDIPALLVGQTPDRPARVAETGVASRVVVMGNPGRTEGPTERAVFGRRTCPTSGWRGPRTLWVSSSRRISGLIGLS